VPSQTLSLWRLAFSCCAFRSQVAEAKREESLARSDAIGGREVWLAAVAFLALCGENATFRPHLSTDLMTLLL